MNNEGVPQPVFREMAGCIRPDDWSSLEVGTVVWQSSKHSGSEHRGLQDELEDGQSAQCPPADQRVCASVALFNGIDDLTHEVRLLFVSMVYDDFADEFVVSNESPPIPHWHGLDAGAVDRHALVDWFREHSVPNSWYEQLAVPVEDTFSDYVCWESADRETCARLFDPESVNLFRLCR